jgi:hypothetical protein
MNDGSALILCTPKEKQNTPGVREKITCACACMHSSYSCVCVHSLRHSHTITVTLVLFKILIPIRAQVNEHNAFGTRVPLLINASRPL